MLFFVDESWQPMPDGKHKAGVLAALQIKSHDFNLFSQDIYKIKGQSLGFSAANRELKGNQLLRKYVFDLEKDGVKSNELNLVRDIFDYIKTKGSTLFGSIVFDETEADLACANANELERPFFYLFERIDLFMKENHPGLMAKIVFDDRGVQNNQKISASVSNFFHKCSAGLGFDNIIKVPFFAISTENIGIQIADIVAYILCASFTTRRADMITFHLLAKGLAYKSRTTTEINGKKYSLNGFKVIKKREAGGSDIPGRAT